MGEMNVSCGVNCIDSGARLAELVDAERAAIPDQRTLDAIRPFLDAIPFYVTIVDEAHVVLEANQAFRQALHIDPAAVRGTYCPKTVHGTDDPYPGCPVEEAVRTGGSVEREFHDAESDRWVESMAYPVRLQTESGRRLFVHFIRDISERKRLESELRQLKDDLERQVVERTIEVAAANVRLAQRALFAEEARARTERVALSRERLAHIGELSAGVAHTLRNPLHAAITVTDHMRAKTPAEDTDMLDLLAGMKEALARMESVTRRLLSLTRETPLTRVPVDVTALVKDTLSFVDRRCEHAAVRLETDLIALPPWSLDPNRLSDALINAVDNAIHACRAGGTVTVRARVTQAVPPALHLEIQDTGEGIPAELLAKVFEPFFTTKAIGEGSGLGLAIARRVAEQHGGQLELESRPGTGTLLRFVLPGPVVGS